MDEDTRKKMIADFIAKHGAKLCKQGESGNNNKGLSAWSRISFDKDTHPLDRQEKEARGHKNKKDKKKVNKRK